MTTPKGFAAYETIGFSFPNRNLGDCTSMAAARELVAAGTKRWAQLGGGVLALVEPTAELEWYEHFLIETSPNVFEALPDRTGRPQSSS